MEPLTAGRRLALLGLALVVVAFAHGPALDAGFVYDDRVTVLDNPLVQSLGHLPRFFTEHYWAGSGRALGRNYRPLVLVSFALNNALSGLDPRGWHALSVALHLGAVAVLFGSLQRRAGALAEALVALLFGVHPLTTEAVVGISNRGDVMVVLFGLAALWAWGAGRRGLGVLLAGTALLCKENAVALLPALFVVDLRLGRRPWRAWVALGAVAACWLAARTAAVGTLLAGRPGRIDNPLAYLPPLDQKLLAMSVLARQAALVAWPRTLSVDHGAAALPLTLSEAGATVALGFLVAAGWIALALWAWQYRSPAVEGLVLAGCAYLVTSNLLVPADAMMVERFMVLPLAGLALALGAVAAALPRWSAGVALVAGVALAARTATRAADWRDTATLMEAATRATPASARAWYGVGHEAMASGDLARADAALARAVALAPDYPHAWSDWALVQGDLGRHEGAVRAARRATELSPTDPLAMNNLGVALYRAGALVEAADAFGRAVALDPGFDVARRNLAEVQGDLRGARPAGH